MNGYSQNRFYLPVDRSLDAKEYLNKYVAREFPYPNAEDNAIYSIPGTFKKNGEQQASLAEYQVFERLHNLGDSHEDNHRKINGLWMIFLHNTSYAGHSFRNRRIGKLIMREHDFVLFVKYQGEHFFVLVEVKSTNSRLDNNNAEKISDAKEIKNNRRSAQHQLRDHMEILQTVNSEFQSNFVQCYIMWPFLDSHTQDPHQQTVKRWKEDRDLHVFEETIASQDRFDEWFLENVLRKEGIREDIFKSYLNRFIVLSSAVFVKEISENVMALMTQEQLQLLQREHSKLAQNKALVVHGAAGTGKTLLVLRKLEQLYQNGELDEHNRALYICYWPGIRCDIELKLEALGIKSYVDTVRFYITLPDFLIDNKKSYKHIFMDEAEALCLALDVRVIQQTLASIYRSYHDGNCTLLNCPHSVLEPGQNIVEKLEQHYKIERKGELWFMVDINQAFVFLLKHVPQILKSPSLVLTKVMRSTGYIFNVFHEFYTQAIPNICLGHDILGPSVFWVNLNKDIDKIVASVVVDLCSSKGFIASDVCVLPFLVNERLTPESVNKYIDLAFAENAFRPQATSDVEFYLKNKECNTFLVPWTLRVKGLEFKVVIAAVDADDFDFDDSEDRKRFYIMISRCTSMLILVSTKAVKSRFDSNAKFKDYQFDVELD